MGFQIGTLAFQAVRKGNVIRIHSSNKGAARQCYPLIERRYKSFIGALHKANARITNS